MRFALWAWSAKVQRHVLAAEGNYPDGDVMGFIALWRLMVRDMNSGDAAAEELTDD